LTTVLICDDSRPAREGLRRSVSGVPGVDRVDTAASGEEVLARFAAERPDLVLMDTRMPGLSGLEAAMRLVTAHPEANVIMMTGPEDSADRETRDAVARAIAVGAKGYLVKDVSAEELAAAVTMALTDAVRRSEQTDERQFTPPPGRAPQLTERERQVLDGMAAGKSNGEIGRQLYLSEDTVKTHARRLFRKLGAADRAQAGGLPCGDEAGGGRRRRRHGPPRSRR
jgi:DNA-binding NarL/FixJ family response regulator